MELNDFKQSMDERIRSFMDNDYLSEQSAFFRVVVADFVEYGMSEGISYVDMEDDIKFGSKLIHIDGYSVDETEHSLNLYICDYDYNENAVRLSSSMLDKLYWRLYYFLEASCANEVYKYFEGKDTEYRAALHIRQCITKSLADPERILKIHLVIVTNKELDTKLLGNDVFGTRNTRSTRKKNNKSRKKVK